MDEGSRFRCFWVVFEEVSREVCRGLLTHECVCNCFRPVHGPPPGESLSLASFPCKSVSEMHSMYTPGENLSLTEGLRCKGLRFFLRVCLSDAQYRPHPMRICDTGCVQKVEISRRLPQLFWGLDSVKLTPSPGLFAFTLPKLFVSYRPQPNVH